MNERDILAQKDFAVKEALARGLAEGEARGKAKGKAKGLVEEEAKSEIKEKCDRYSGKSHSSYRLPPRSQQWQLSS